MTPTRRFVGRIVVRQRSVAGRSVNARCSVQQQRRQQLKYAAGGAVYGVCSTSPGKAPSSGADKQWRRRFTGFRSCCLTSLVWRDVRRSSSNRQLCCCCCWRYHSTSPTPSQLCHCCSLLPLLFITAFMLARSTALL